MAQPPVVPGMVPLRVLVDGLVAKTHSELVLLADTLPAVQNAAERKERMLRFSTHWRMQWVKLLVLVRWARRVGDLGSLVNALAFLDIQDSFFSGAADQLFRIHSDMLLMRDPNYDIVTAVDMLSNGNFQRLPSIIKKSTIPPAPLTPAQIKNTLVRLQDLIRMRLLADDVIPYPFRKSMIIARGCVTFKVENKFQVTLSLQGGSPELSWKIVDLQILVNFVKEDYEGVIGIHDYQLNGIIASAAQSLIPPSTPASGTDIAGPPKVEEVLKTPNFHPLVALHDHLDRFCVHLQMEILRAQINHLARTRWNTHIAYEMTPNQPDGTSLLKIRYWCGSRAVPADGGLWKHYIDIRLSTTQSESHSFSGSKDNESVKPNLVALANTHSRANSTYTRRYFAVRAYSVLKPLPQSGANLKANALPSGSEVLLSDHTQYPSRPTEFVLDSSLLDIEQVLTRVAYVQAKNLAMTIQKSLTETDRAEDKSVSDFVKVVAHFGVGDANTFQDPRVEVMYRPDKIACLTVDVRTGFVHVSELGEGAGLNPLVLLGGGIVDEAARSSSALKDSSATSLSSAEMLSQLKQIERDVNQDVSHAKLAIRRLKYSTFLAETRTYAEACKQKGISVLSKLPLNETLLKEICDPIPNHFILISVWSDCFIFVAVGDFEEMCMGSLVARADAEAKREDAIYRAWMVVKSNAGTRANAVSIKCVVPIRHDHVSMFLQSGGTSSFQQAISEHDLFAMDVEESGENGAGGQPKLKRSLSEGIDVLHLLGKQPKYHSFWNSMSPDIFDVLLAYSKKQLSWLSVLSQVDNLSVDYTFCLEKPLDCNPIPPEQLAITTPPKIMIHPFFFDIVRSIQSRTTSSEMKDRPATVEDLGLKYCFGSLYLFLENDGAIVGKVRLKNELLPSVKTVIMDSSLAQFNMQTYVVSLSVTQSDDCAREILRHWKGLAAIAEVASQIWTRKNWFKEHGIEIESYNVGTLTLRIAGCPLLSKGSGDQDSCLLRLRWRRFVPQAAQQHKSSTLDQFHVEIVDNEVVDVDAMDEGFGQANDCKVWVRLMEQVLNECLDMVIFAKRIKAVSNVLCVLKELEGQLSLPEYTVDGNQVVTVTPKSLTWVRLVIGNLGIDVYLFSNDTILIHDAAHGCADQTMDGNLVPIPFFTTTPPSAPLQQRTPFISSLSEYLKSKDLSEGTRLKLAGNGLLFTSNVMEPVLTRIALHMDIAASLDWFQYRSEQLFGENQIRVKNDSLQFKLVFHSVVRTAGWLVSPDRSMLFSVKRSGERAPDAVMQRLCTYINYKLRLLTPATVNMRIILDAFLHITELPDLIINDLIKLGSELDMKHTDTARAEWCIVMPPGGPDYLPAAGRLSFLVDRDIGRVSAVFRLHGVDGTQQLFPIRYNYQTNVISPWRKDEDLTQSQQGAFLQERLQQLSRDVKQDPCPFNKIFVPASTKDVPVNQGGPGKMFVILRHVCSKYADFKEAFSDEGWAL
ncbi:Mediator of RNA polymerase II transcription subunit 14 [Chytriomyces hyalinus]|nr:Mediator of RNA polymerase II transcription subunit 14 [Chytriomyces hyalinus]